MSPDSASRTDRVLVQLASYNTALQGVQGVPQDLVDWLSPTLEVSNFLARDPRGPDIVAVGFQELLPLHLGREYYLYSKTYRITYHHSFGVFEVCHREQECPHSFANRSLCS